MVATYEGVQTIPDKQLATVGAKRSSCIRIPYFGVALKCIPGTELVLTLTSGMTMTSVIKNDRSLRLVKAPQELHAFHFLMDSTLIRVMCGFARPYDQPSLSTGTIRISGNN